MLPSSSACRATARPPGTPVAAVAPGGPRAGSAMARPAEGLGMGTPCDRGRFVVPASPVSPRGMPPFRTTGSLPRPARRRPSRPLPSPSMRPGRRPPAPQSGGPLDNSLYIRRPPRRTVNSLGGGWCRRPARRARTARRATVNSLGGGGGVSQADRPAVMRLDRAPRQRMAPFGAGDGPARRPRLQRRRG